MRRWMIVTCADGHALLDATRAARQRGWRIVDAFTPCPVHGLEDALGLRPSRLPWVCFLCGLAGAAFMMWFQHWTSAVDWRLNVGGRPWNSSLSFACVAFEVMVLAAGLGSVLAMLVTSRLGPGKQPRIAIPRVTDDAFALVLEETSELLTDAMIRRAIGTEGLLAITELLVEEHER